jgi:hypothetical protein
MYTHYSINILQQHSYSVFEYKTLSTYINVLLRSTLSQLPKCIWSDYSSLLRQCVISINCQYIIIDISNHSLYTMKIKPFSECLHLRFFTDHFPFRRSSSDTADVGWPMKYGSISDIGRRRLSMIDLRLLASAGP